MSQSIRDKSHRISFAPGDAIAGDIILAECRKPGDWKVIRGSQQHRTRVCTLKKNAYAVINRKFTSVKSKK